MRPSRTARWTCRILLAAYPGNFRATAGEALLADFDHGYSAARARHGRLGALSYAARQWFDLVRNVGPEWRRPTGRAPRRRQGFRGALGGCLHDLGSAVRSLRRDPWFATATLLVVGLGMGALVTIYGVVESVLLEPLPYPNSERLVSLFESYRETQQKSVAYPNFVDWRERNSSLEDLGARARVTVNLTGRGPARALRGMGMSPNLTEILGVQPILGRTFTEAEANQRNRVVLLSEGLWRDQFGSEAEVLSETVLLDGEPYSVVGVLPPLREYPLSGADLWIPLQTALNTNNLSDRTNHPGIEAFGRRKVGVSLEAARTDLDRVAAALALEYPESNTEAGITTSDLRTRVVSSSAPTLWALFAAVGFVMLAICANVASLMLARSARRRGEIAVRAALGAGRIRLARQILAEGVVLCGTAGVLGLAIAIAGTRWVRESAAIGVPRLASVAVDPSVASFAAAAALLSGVLVSVAAIARTRKVGPATALRQAGERGASVRIKARTALVVVQIALAVVLLTGAGLMIRSVGNLHAADIGISPRQVFSAYVGPPQTQYPETADRVQLYRQIAEGIGRLPAAGRVSGGDPLPMSGRNNQSTLSHDGYPHIDEQGLRVETGRVMPGYFDVLGIPLLTGRDFREDDTEAHRVAIVDETLAEFLYPGGDAIGNRIRFRGDPEDRPWFTIVGVVAHVKNYGARHDSRHQLYLPYTVQAWGMSILVEMETTAATETVVDGMREAVAAVDPDLPLTRTQWIRSYVEDSIADEALVARTLAAFAGTALLVSVIGLYGVTAFAVAARTREFGIRIALGAEHGGVLRRILWEGLLIAALGIGLGLAGAAATGQMLSGLLYEVEPFDLGTLAAVSLIVGVVALLGSIVPARHALGIDPSRALRD